MYTNGQKPFVGRSEERFAQSITEKVDGKDIKFASTQGYSEMMAVRHMDFYNNLRAVFVGVAVHSTQ
jgi:hypothetical protein